jgi:type IV secretory pathway TraG/TraD family ATPase VirD4
VSVPSGNEYITLSDRRAAWVWRLGWILLGPLLLWINLAWVAAAVWPVRGGPLISLGRLGVIWTLGKILFNVRAAVDLGRPSFLTHQWSDLHVWWAQWWQLAQPHLVGGPNLDRVIAANIALALFILLGFGLWARSIRVGRPPDARPGTSHWAPPDKLRPYIKAVDTPGALPLGCIRQPAWGAGTPIALPPLRRFAHVGVWGVTEAGKTSGIFKPWLIADALLNDPTVPFGAMSSVAIDIKHPDLYDTLVPYIAPLSRRFVLLAPGSPELSMSYNALEHLDPQDLEAYKSDVDALAYAIVENTVFAHKDVPYYRAIETRLLQLLIQFAVEADGHLPQEDLEPLTRHLLRGQSLPRVRSFPFLALLTALGHKDFLQLIEATITDPDRPDLWRARFAQFHDMSGHDLTGVLHGLQRRLAAFAAPDIARISTHSHRVRLDTLGKQPTTLIVGMQTVNPETIQTYAALIITQLIQQLVRLADRSPGRRLPVPVTIYLDEISNTARIPAIEDNIATLRDNGISFVLGLQDDSGLQQRYGEEAARKIVANLNTKVVLGRNLHIAQAIDTARMAGETTILTHSASAGNRGSSENQHPARRGLVTPDQVRRMEQYEALVFLQEGVITKTRLFPFPPRDPATGEWILLYGSRREQALFHPLRQKFETLAFDRRLARPHLTLRRSATTNGADGMFPVWPIYRLRHRDLSLDGTLGPLIPSGTPSLPRVPPEPAGQPAELSQPSPASEKQQAAPPAEQAQQAVDVLDKELPSPPDSEASPSPAPQPAEIDEASPNGLGEAASPAASSVQGPDANALGEMTGFFRSIARRKITVPECEHGGAPAGWRITLPEGPFVLVRHSFVLAYGERRRTKPQDILDRWRTVGLIAASRVDVTVEKSPVQVLAFTPLAVSRFIPAIRDEISTWSLVGRGQVHGLSSTVVQAAPASRVSLPALSRPLPVAKSRVRTSDPLRNDPNEALEAVIGWARARKSELSTPMSELGQWEATSHGMPVLLVRTNHAMRILISRRFNTHAVLVTWRDQGIIVARPNRFTLYMKNREQGQRTGTTFVAFAWEALERAGLKQDGSVMKQRLGETP